MVLHMIVLLTAPFALVASVGSGSKPDDDEQTPSAEPPSAEPESTSSDRYQTEIVDEMCADILFLYSGQRFSHPYQLAHGCLSDLGYKSDTEADCGEYQVGYMEDGSKSYTLGELARYLNSRILPAFVIINLSQLSEGSRGLRKSSKTYCYISDMGNLNCMSPTLSRMPGLEFSSGTTIVPPPHSLRVAGHIRSGLSHSPYFGLWSNKIGGQSLMQAVSAARSDMYCIFCVSPNAESLKGVAVRGKRKRFGRWIGGYLPQGHFDERMYLGD
ncbi:MAG: hypothetical protein M1829_000661 [Trizodia sp. TS-e1964]|nr:MAG: hypothetical protein M1829_000661 [Trizodia sp. TS-e1964]